MGSTIVVAKRLADELRSKGIGPKEAAKAIGVSRTAVQKWLAGGGVTVGHQGKVAKFLGTTVDDMILRDESKTATPARDSVSIYKASTISNLVRQIDHYRGEVNMRKALEHSLEAQVELLREEIQIKQRLIDEAGIVDRSPST